ncbi:protein of unknown function [Blastococcus saxobsidens DD2]|uniref:Uncharacterized protein n=1 Tax=Blastococcus saxobsidens (strain DD2) TaxID=1146883 RepID=H6RSZ9_BLASD|nr:protein of unknown function [Blastococcus saxobsidens DD2]
MRFGHSCNAPTGNSDPWPATPYSRRESRLYHC